MRNDIQTLKTTKAYSEPAKKRPGHPGQDFESLLRERTESYRAKKTGPDTRKSHLAKKDSDDSIGKDIGKDLKKDIAPLEERTAGSVSGPKDNGQEDTETEKDISTSAYLIQDLSVQQTSTSLTLESGQAAEVLTAGGHAEAVTMMEAGVMDPAQRMKDDGVKDIPTLPADNLQRIEDPAEAVKAKQEKEGTGQQDTQKPAMTEILQKSIQEAGLKADSLKIDGRMKADLKPESLSGIAEGMKGMEKAGSISQNPLETVANFRDLLQKGKAKEEAGHETSEKDAGIEALKGLTSAMKTGEARPVQEAQKTEGLMAADRNMQLAATEIVHQVETLKDGDRTTIKVRLYPEEIGEMEITLSMEEGKLSGKILVENKEMRQVFTERLSELNQTLKSCHIDVAKFEVGIGAGQQQGNAGQHGQKPAAYKARFLSYGTDAGDKEEIGKTIRTAARGIDLLA
jgi:flagellar hook-length control protein FliK